MAIEAPLPPEQRQPLLVVGEALSRYSGLVRFVVRFPWMLVAAGGLMSARMTASITGDLIRFARAGDWLVHGDLAAIYAGSWMQGGPFELIFSYGLLPAPRQHVAQYYIASEGHLIGLHAVLGVALMLCLLWGVKHLRCGVGLARSRNLEFAVGLVALLDLLPKLMWQGGHPAEIGIAAFWIWAGSLAVRGRPTRAAIVIGLSTGWEPWGLLAAGLLLTDRRPRQLLLNGAVFAVSAVLPYVPFVLTGHFALFDLTWPIAHGTLISVIWPHASSFTWLMRLIQGAGSSMAAGAVVLALGRRRDTVWLAPLAALIVRLLCDPLDLGYYWHPLLLLSLVGVGFLHGSCSLSRVSGVLALAYVPGLYLSARLPWVNGDVLLFAALVLVVVLVVLIRREDPESLGRSPSELGSSRARKDSNPEAGNGSS